MLLVRSRFKSVTRSDRTSLPFSRVWFASIRFTRVSSLGESEFRLAIIEYLEKDKK